MWINANHPTLQCDGCMETVAPTSGRLAENQRIATALREASDLLQVQGGNVFRIQAYRHAADSIVQCRQPLRDLFDAHGRIGLEALSGIGDGIASAIAEMLVTGHWHQLARLKGHADPETVFRSIPGVGRALAHRLHEQLQVDSLEELEMAARDGRLTRVSGVGPRRTAAILASLAQLLGRRASHAPDRPGALPDVVTVLDVDREYRQRAGAGTLAMIAPQQFNPDGRAVLPVLHTTRGDWHFTALYSNTARAHQLQKTHDWVVIYFYDQRHAERQCTVVNETHGPLVGQRVIRGREAECLDWREPDAAFELS